MLSHNSEMQNFLKKHGIKCVPKRFDKGSMKCTWRLYGKTTSWTNELREELTSLGFKDFDGNKLSTYSGAGVDGCFQMFVRAPEVY